MQGNFRSFHDYKVRGQAYAKMSLSLKNLALTGLLTLGGAIVQQAYAQESDMQNVPSTKDEYAHKDGLSAPRASESSLTSSTPKNETSSVAEQKSDSVSVAATRDSKTLVKNDKTKDAGDRSDMVSFNFLYYIIQRYKMADIVDQ